MDILKIEISRCGVCPFFDSGLSWCVRYYKKVTIHDETENKPSWCLLKRLTMELE